VRNGVHVCLPRPHPPHLPTPAPQVLLQELSRANRLLGWLQRRLAALAAALAGRGGLGRESEAEVAALGLGRLPVAWKVRRWGSRTYCVCLPRSCVGMAVTQLVSCGGRGAAQAVCYPTERPLGGWAEVRGQGCVWLCVCAHGTHTRAGLHKHLSQTYTRALTGFAIRPPPLPTRTWPCAAPFCAAGWRRARPPPCGWAGWPSRPPSPPPCCRRAQHARVCVLGQAFTLSFTVKWPPAPLDSRRTSLGPRAWPLTPWPSTSSPCGTWCGAGGPRQTDTHAHARSRTRKRTPSRMDTYKHSCACGTHTWPWVRTGAAMPRPQPSPTSLRPTTQPPPAGPLPTECGPLRRRLRARAVAAGRLLAGGRGAHGPAAAAARRAHSAAAVAEALRSRQPAVRTRAHTYFVTRCHD
jgi:hypothetical protein